MALDKIIVDYELELKKFKAQTKDIDKELKKTEKAVDGSAKTVSKGMEGVGATVKKIGLLVGGAFAVQKVIAFGKQLLEIRKQAEGVERAFAKIPDSSKLLKDLKRETGGVVSELKLMQTAVKASQFKIPLEQLGSLLKFANIRARETGESVDFLVDSIINGVSRKSLPILDNLGLSMNEIRGEMKKTGDMSQAVFAIVNKELEAAGDVTALFADNSDRANANLENLNRTLSTALAPSASSLSRIFADLTGRLDEMAKQVFATDEAVSGGGVPFLRELKNQAAEINDSGELQRLIDSYFDIIQTTAQAGDLTKSDEFFLKKMNTAVGILQKRMEELNGTVDNFAIVSIATLNGEIKTLKERIDAAQIGSFEFEQATAQLAAKQDKLNDVLVTYNALLNARKNIEEDLSDDFDVIPDDLNVGVPSEDQEDDLVAETERILEKVGEKYDEFRSDQEEKNETFFVNAMESQGEQFMERMNSVTEFADAIAGLQLASLDRQLQNKTISEEQYDKRKKEILKRQARREKAVNVFENIIATFAAITKALPNIPLAALAGATGLANTAAIIAQPLPKFAKGVVQLDGKGTETSDSIPALLSKNESVITAAGTRQDVGLFKAANKMELDKYITQNYVLPELAKSGNMDDQAAALLHTFGAGLSGSDVGIRTDLKGIKNQSKINTVRLAEAFGKALKAHPRHP